MQQMKDYTDKLEGHKLPQIGMTRNEQAATAAGPPAHSGTAGCHLFVFVSTLVWTRLARVGAIVVPESRRTFLTFLTCFGCIFALWSQIERKGQLQWSFYGRFKMLV